MSFDDKQAFAKHIILPPHVQMERIRQNSQYSFEQFNMILKRKDKKIVTDVKDKLSMQKSLENLKFFEENDGYDKNATSSNSMDFIFDNEEEKQLGYEMLAILEGDLSRLQSGQENVSNPLSYVLESCWSRKGAMPFSISITPNRILQKIAKKEPNMAYLRIRRSKVQNTFPASSFIDSDMGWLKAPYDQQHILSLEYVFILRSPSIITEANYDRICNLEGIQLTVVRSFNYFNYLLNRQGKTMTQRIESPQSDSDYLQHYISTSKCRGYLVSGFSFMHPQEALEVIQILRDQSTLNFMLEMVFCRSSSTKNLTKMALFTISFNANAIMIEFGHSSVEIFVENGQFEIKFPNNEVSIAEDFKSRCIDVLSKSLSIPILMHIFINEGLDNSVFDVDMKKKFIQDVIEPYHDFLLHENSGFDGIGKVGLSWLSVNCKMQENAKNATKAINGSDFRGKAHRGHHTFTVVEEDDNMTLLKSTKNVEVTKELISPPLPALQRQNIAQLLRGMAAAQTPVRTQSSDSSIPMLNNAFSDLEAIAEIGAAADDTESQVSEQSTKSSSFIENYSPSGSQSAQQFQRAGSVTTQIPIQMSPVEQHKMNTNLYKRRLMQQNASTLSGSSATEVFEFVPDDNIRHPGPGGMPLKMPPQYGDPNLYSAGPQFTPAGSATPLPNYQSPTGRGRRGRGRRAGNVGERPFVPGDQQQQSPLEFSSPDSPLVYSAELGAGSGGSGNGRKRRGAGTPTQRGPRKQRMKPANTSASELVPTPTTNFIFPTQFPPPNVVVQQQLQQQQQKQGAYPSHTVVPRPMNFIASQLPSTEDQRMALYENCFEDSDDDGECDPPPPPPPKLQVEPKVSEQHQVITSAAVKSEKIQPNQKTTSSSKTDATRKPSSVSSTSTTTSSTTPIQSPHVSLVQLEATKPELTKKLSSVVPYPTLTSSMSSPSQILAADNAQSQAQYKQIKGEPQIPKSFIQQQQKSLKDTETDSNTLESEIKNEQKSESINVNKQKELYTAQKPNQRKDSVVAESKPDKPLKVRLKFNVDGSKVDKAQKGKHSSSSSSPCSSTSSQSAFETIPSLMNAPTQRLSSSAAPPTKPKGISYQPQPQKPPQKRSTQESKADAPPKKKQPKAVASEPTPTTKAATITANVQQKSATKTTSTSQEAPDPAAEAVASIMPTSLLKSGYKIPKFREQEASSSAQSQQTALPQQTKSFSTKDQQPPISVARQNNPPESRQESRQYGSPKKEQHGNYVKRGGGSSYNCPPRRGFASHGQQNERGGFFHAAPRPLRYPQQQPPYIRGGGENTSAPRRFQGPGNERTPPSSFRNRPSHPPRNSAPPAHYGSGNGSAGGPYQSGWLTPHQQVFGSLQQQQPQFGQRSSFNEPHQQPTLPFNYSAAGSSFPQSSVEFSQSAIVEQMDNSPPECGLSIDDGDA